MLSIFQIYILFTQEGTFDDGDSVHHYFYSKYAFKYPHFFIHQWAKPVYVLGSCLFAQFGFIGIKAYNLIILHLSGFISYLIASKFQLEYPIYTYLILLLMPQVFAMGFSGLTEPTFALVGILSFYFLTIEKYTLSSILISFSQFARPEGLFFIGIFLALFLFMKKYRSIPFLCTGHLIITFMGMIFFDEKSVLWVFNKNPNAVLNPYYNETGEWTHYIEGLQLTTGTPIFYLILIGFLIIVFSLFKKLNPLKLTLLLCFLSVIISHTIFWKYGLFKSFGLYRVLVCICPFAAIISVFGIDFILRLAKKFRATIMILFMVVISSYPFLAFEYSLNFWGDFRLTQTQELKKEVANYLSTHYPHSLYYSFAPSLRYFLNIDHFDWQKRQTLDHRIMTYEDIPKDAIVVWDDWYAKVEGRIDTAELKRNKQLKYLKTFKKKSYDQKMKTIVLFKQTKP